MSESLESLVGTRQLIDLSSVIELPPLLPIPEVVGPLGGNGCSMKCLYCYNIHVAKLMREIWQRNPLLVHTEASTHICYSAKIGESSAEQERFLTYPWEELIRDDIGCATIEGDPGDPAQREWFWKFLPRAASSARLVFKLSKFPFAESELPELARYENFRLVFSITGIGPPIERVKTKALVRMFKLCKAAGVQAYAAIHPYVAFGVSKLDFLGELAEYLPEPNVSIRGFSFDPEAMPEMAEHMTAAAREYYGQRIGQYALPDDGWS